MELEASAETYEVHEYEEMLNNLESERRELEEERIELQVFPLCYSDDCLHEV